MTAAGQQERPIVIPQQAVQWPCLAAPHRLWSLLDMLRFHADAFVQAMGLLPQLSQMIARGHYDGADLVQGFGQSIGELKRQCERLHLPVSMSQIRVIVARLDGPNPNWNDFGPLMSDLYGRVIHELATRTFLLVPSERSEHYAEPLRGWEVPLNAFPSAQNDIEEAEKCYALERSTACVFHLMRTLEVPLKALSAHLGIVKHSPTWEAYLSVMATNIQAKYPDKSRAHQEMRSYFSALEGQLRAIKTAWRNPTMHEIARVYTPEMAHELLVYVRGFLREAARELREVPP